MKKLHIQIQYGKGTTAGSFGPSKPATNSQQGSGAKDSRKEFGAEGEPNGNKLEEGVGTVDPHTHWLCLFGFFACAGACAAAVCACVSQCPYRTGCTRGGGVRLLGNIFVCLPPPCRVRSVVSLDSSVVFTLPSVDRLASLTFRFSRVRCFTSVSLSDVIDPAPLASFL